MVSINQMADAIIRELAEYSESVKEEMQQAADDLTKDGVSMLQSSSPERTGKYARSWARKKTKTGYVIHNKNHYRLTHLLEHGHVKRGGGRVAAKAHIRPVEERLVEQFTRRVEDAIRS